MPAQHNTSGTCTLLLSLYIKFMNNFQKHTEYFNTFLHILATEGQLYLYLLD